MGGGFSTWELWPAFYQQFMPVWAVGMVLSSNFLQSALGFAASGWIMRRFKAVDVMLAGEVYARMIMLPALIFPSPASPALMALGGASYGPSTVASGTLLHEEFTDHQRATMASITSLLSNAVYAVFALGIGLVADRWGAGRAIMVGQLMLLPIIWLYWRVRSARMRRAHHRDRPQG
jgi:MFS family permease